MLCDFFFNFQQEILFSFTFNRYYVGYLNKQHWQEAYQSSLFNDHVFLATVWEIRVKLASRWISNLCFNNHKNIVHSVSSNRTAPSSHQQVSTPSFTVHSLFLLQNKRLNKPQIDRYEIAILTLLKQDIDNQ